MSTSDKKIKRRTFFKTCGLAFVGMELPEKSLVMRNLDETNLQQVKIDQLPYTQLPCVKQQVDYVVVGGGVAGVCSAITAARAGLKVVLIQDRPVLGGNASSEVRLWVLGATSHMGNNNRWAREGGVLDELIVENMYRNKEGNPIFFDALLLEKVWAESNILLLLNTAVYAVEMEGQDRVGKVIGFC
ncbi:FAD-dependent oxidoreductase, partial [uncultured Parabacteroides sp.]